MGLADIFYLKGIVEAIFTAVGAPPPVFQPSENNDLADAMQVSINGIQMVEMGSVATHWLKKFDIRQPVFIAVFNWEQLLRYTSKTIRFTEIPKFPAVERDLAIVVDKTLPYDSIRQQVDRLKLGNLKHMKLFDVFESEKLGAGKKSMAVNFIFLDEEKTLTDKEIDKWMQKIMQTLEKDLQAEIRKQ